MTIYILTFLLGLAIGFLVVTLRNGPLSPGPAATRHPPTPNPPPAPPQRPIASHATPSEDQYRILAKAIADVANGQIGGGIGPGWQNPPRY